MSVLSLNVLIVDDQPEVADSMAAGVNWARVQVENVFTAYSVAAAQRVFERERIDVLLCDIEMPPTNGFQLLRWVQERFSGVVCIFLTAHAEFEYAQEAVKLGSFDYILQPAPYAEIEAAVQRAAGKVREAENQRRYSAYAEYRGADADGAAQAGADKTPVQKAMDYVRRNLDRDLSRADIAEAIYLNPEYLSRLFKKETGASLSDYITAEKMRAAQGMLVDTNVPVSLIATKVGFSNFSYFSQVFKRHTGLSPVEYRAAKRRSKL